MPHLTEHQAKEWVETLDIPGIYDRVLNNPCNTLHFTSKDWEDTAMGSESIALDFAHYGYHEAADRMMAHAAEFMRRSRV